MKENKRWYEVVIDRSSATIHVEAKNQEEAQELALRRFVEEESSSEYEYWVGVCDEVSERDVD